MKIWETIKSNNIFSKYKDLKKNFKIMNDGMLRPSNFFANFHTTSGMVYPKYPYGLPALYDLAYNSDTLTIVHNALRRELFRNGYDLVEAKNTDEELTTSEQDTNTAGKTKEEILKFLEKVNENDQSLMDVLFQIEDDFSIMDDGFMIFLFDYEFKDNGEFESRKLNEILRGDPRFMGPIINKFGRPGYTDDNTPFFTCPEHRTELIEGKDTCPQCKAKCFQAFYFLEREGSKVYYFKSEVVFRSKYRPSTTRGYSPIITAWQKVRTLLFMDKYVRELYDGQRPPKSGLFFKTSNQAGLEKSMNEAKQRLRENPHWPMTMAVPDGGNGNKFMEFVDFMKPLDELQHTEMRNEYRKQIGAVYGVEPIFQGDQSQSGGLNNEGLQVTVTNRAVEYGQGIYNNHFFPKILEAMGVSGFMIILNPSEEQDEMAKLQRQQQSLINGEIAVKLGLDADYDDDTGEVFIKQGKLEAPPEGFSSGFDKPSTPQAGSPAPIELSNKALLVKARARPPFTRLANTLKNLIDSFIKKFKRKPTEAELQKAMIQVNFNLKREMQESAKRFFKETYARTMGDVEKEMGVNVVFNQVDENAIQALESQPVLSDAYTNLSNDMTTKINGLIKESFRTPQGLSSAKLTKQIKELGDVADFHAENIARTSTSQISSAARKNSYAKEPEFETFKFKHIGPDDGRTTLTSKRIKERTQDGVSWNDYVNIVTEESARQFPTFKVNPDWPISHWQTRHSYVKLSEL